MFCPIRRAFGGFIVSLVVLTLTPLATEAAPQNKKFPKCCVWRVINAKAPFYLVGSIHALIVTGYGQLLMLKLVLFAIMLALAAINRFWLTPRLGLSPDNEPQLEALRQLARNSITEIALGLTIFAIVGVLGTLHPAIHLM